MTVKVSYTVFGNFGSKKLYEVDTSDKVKIKELVWNDIKNEDWDWPITENDLEITKVVEI